ncbi:MAG: aminotransferase class I/II-fold pyridoxal phosphate-dependent enzyme [Planctomycetota bacterium]
MGHVITNGASDGVFERAARLCPGIGHGVDDGDPLVAPLVQSTTFGRASVGTNPPHQYSRVSNPTVSVLEEALGGLEETPAAVCFGSGLAAETALFLALLKAGDHVVCSRFTYGGTTRLLTDLLPGLGVRCTFVDATDLNEVEGAVCPQTKLVFIETPSNPTLELTDIAACAEIAHRVGALLAVDNTFLTAVLQRPLEHGADISVYSTTKFIDGHSVATGGALVAQDSALLTSFRFIRKCTGAIQTPLNAWLTVNGLKTLPLRIAAQSETAETLAGWLSSHPGVSATYHPSLADRGGQAIITKQHPAGNGAVVSFELKGNLATARWFAEALQLCTLVEHVGSVETLVTHPATMTHADVNAEERQRVGIRDGLFRISVGLEPLAAIREDLERGFAAAQALGCEQQASGLEVLTHA